MKTITKKQFERWMEGIVTEIVAGKVIFPKSEEDKAWNGASTRAVDIVNKYKRFDGMFQMDDVKEDENKNA